MDTEYDNTPSFYKEEEFFENYLGRTSYYLGLQRVLKKIIMLTEPRQVLELGSALGTTTISLANEFPKINFTGIDLRESVVQQANSKVKELQNVNFKCGDMTEVAKENLDEYDLIFMLYSFHHILDPLENKMKFLENCYSNMRKGARLLIEETFLPDGVSAIKRDEMILQLWKQRGLEGYASTFWAALDSLTQEGLEETHRIAKVSQTEEIKAGDLVYVRDGEYLIESKWLVDAAKKAGFKVLLAEPVNCVEENAILLER